jgi:hypothetical protein
MKTRAILVRRNGAMGVAALVSTATVLVAGIVSAYRPPAGESVLALLVGLGWPVALALTAGWVGYARPWRRHVVVDLATGALSIDGSATRRPGTLTRGEATVLDNGRVRVDLRGGPRQRLRLELTDIASARQLLGELELDRRAGTSQFRVRRLRPYENLLLLTLLFLAVPLAIALSIVSGWLGLLCFVAAVVSPFVVRALARIRLTVGSDGLDLRSPLNHAFIPHARIRSVARIWPDGHERGSTHEGEVVSWGFEVLVDDGSRHRLDTRPERFPAGVWKTDPVFASAFGAWSAWQTAATPAVPHVSALLARGSRSTRAWVASLRDLSTDGASGYRIAALDEHALFAILGDAAAPRELRAGAAVAIANRQEHAPRLRLAADDVADPVVRRVAVACADADPERAALLEAELDEALGAAADADAEPGARTSRR